MRARWLYHLAIAPAFLFEGSLSKLLRLASDLACSPVCLRCLRILQPPFPRHWLRAVQQRLADLACNVCVWTRGWYWAFSFSVSTYYSTFETAFLRSPCYPRIHKIDHTGLRPRDLPTSASRVLGSTLFFETGCLCGPGFLLFLPPTIQES